LIAQKYLPVVTTFIFSVVMSTVMSVAMPFVNTGNIPFPEVLFSILLAILVSFTAGVLVPVGKWGGSYAQNKGLEEGSFPFILVASTPPTIYFTIIMTFVFALQRTGFSGAVWEAFLGDIFIALIIAYITTVITTPFISKIAFWLTT